MRTEDGYIVNQCINGDSAAFGLLVDKYKPGIYALAYSRLRNFHDAEDITQEVFLKAYQKLSTLRRWDSFLAWLYAITSNLCRDLMRERAKRPDCEFIKDKNARFFDYPSINSYQQEQLYESLHEALDSLPQMYRDVLTLYYLGGMESKEIAQFLGTSPAAIRQRLSRARSKLKEEMLDMMSTTYDQQRLQPSFTFRIVEMVKRIKIKPAPSKPLLPLGLSAATGIVLTVLMFSPHLISLTPLGALLGSPLPSETKVMEVGELPVDVLEISEITFLSSEQGDDDGGVAKLPNPQNAFAPPLAPSRQGDTWTKRADMPTARSAPALSVVKGKIYAIGGGVDPTVLSTVEEYDPATNMWTKKTNMPTARTGVSTGVVNDKIYAIGGWGLGKHLSTVEEYDPATDTWTTKTEMPTPRWGLSTCVVNGRIYAIGGIELKNGNLVWLSTVEEYNPTTDTWIKKTDRPIPGGRPAVVMNGKIYVLGGDDGKKVFLTVEEYNPMTDTWTTKTEMPTLRAAHSASVVKEKIYVVGGVGGDDWKCYLSTVEEYNSATDTWTRKADMPTPRANLSTVAVNGIIYAIGGHDDFNQLSTVETYDTGFRSVDAKGKLPTTWGEMKAE